MGNLATLLSNPASAIEVQAALVEAVLLDEAAANPVGPEAANLVLAGPASGSAATPTFRALVAADLPGPVAPKILYSAAGTPLPAATSGLKGARAVVSDATLPTYLGAYVSGGAVVAGVICTGAGWVTG